MRSNSNDDLNVTLDTLLQKKDSTIIKIKEYKTMLKDIKNSILSEKDTINKIDLEIKSMKNPKRFREELIDKVIIPKLLNTLVVLLISAIGFSTMVFSKGNIQLLLGMVLFICPFIYLFSFYKMEISSLKISMESINIRTKREYKSNHNETLKNKEQEYEILKNKTTRLENKLNRIEQEIMDISRSIEFNSALSRNKYYNEKLVVKYTK